MNDMLSFKQKHNRSIPQSLFDYFVILNFCPATLTSTLSVVCLLLSMSTLCSDDNLETCIQCRLGSSADAPSHSNICHSQQVPFLLRSARPVAIACLDSLLF